MDLPSNHTVLSSGLYYYCSGIDIFQSCCETPPVQQEYYEGATQKVSSLCSVFRAAELRLLSWD